MSDVRSTFKIAVDQNGQRSTFALTEETNKVNGQFAYRYDFDLRPDEQILVTPESDVMLFGPTSKELIGAQDCVEVCYRAIYANKSISFNFFIFPSRLLSHSSLQKA